MISAERKQQLHDLVFLTIINDRVAYEKLSPFVAQKRFNAFRFCAANVQRDRLCRMDDRAMDGEERRYVNLLLWEYWGGEFDEMTLQGLPEYTKTYSLYESEFHRSVVFAPQLEFAQPSESLKEETMNQSVPMSAPAFETKHYVFGVDIRNMTEAGLIDAIKRVEVEIADLKAVKTKSSRIAAKVKELEDMLSKIVEALDKK